jgi:hypothetical protein
MTTTISLVNYTVLAPGCAQASFDVTVDSYTSGGIVLDLSTWFPHRIHNVQCQGLSGTSDPTPITEGNNYTGEVRITSRTATATGQKLYVWATTTTIRSVTGIGPNYGPVYVNRDATQEYLISENVGLDYHQKETRMEVANGESLSGITFYVLAHGH